MIYNEKITEHTKGLNSPFKEAGAIVEFSELDLVALRDILRESHPNIWAKTLLTDIESTLAKVSIFD